MTTLRDKALDYLSRREHSRLELKQKLLTKNFSLEEINATLIDLTQRNFQSDQRFAESYVRHRKQAGFGPLKIMAELRERGVDDGLISAAIDLNNEQWREHLILVWQRKFSKSDRTSKDIRKKHQQCRFLLSRGFCPEAIRKMVA